MPPREKSGTKMSETRVRGGGVGDTAFAERGATV